MESGTGRFEAEQVLRLAPPPGEARRVFASVLGAEWLGLVEKKWLRSPGERVEGLMKKWAKRVLVELGYKPYQTVSRAEGDMANVAVKAAGRGGYRLLTIVVSSIYTFKSRAWGKMHLVLDATILYGAMTGKNARIIDPILPRMKRRIIAPTRSLVIRRKIVSISGEHGATSNLPLEGLQAPEGEATSATEVLELRDLKGKKPSLRVDLRAGRKCSLALVEYEEYRAKYVLIIPPLVMWKWGSYLIPKSVLYEEADDEACPQP